MPFYVLLLETLLFTQFDGQAVWLEKKKNDPSFMCPLCRFFVGKIKETEMKRKLMTLMTTELAWNFLKATMLNFNL